MFGLDQTANVYTPNGTNGDYTVLAKSGLPCRLAYLPQGQGGSDIGGERADTGSRRRLLWAEDYAMPDDAQIEVEDKRWNVLAGTPGALRGPDSRVVYRRCEVVIAL